MVELNVPWHRPLLSHVHTCCHELVDAARFKDSGEQLTVLQEY
jgi:hypothetical protein